MTDRPRPGVPRTIAETGFPVNASTPVTAPAVHAATQATPAAASRHGNRRLSYLRRAARSITTVSASLSGRPLRRAAARLAWVTACARRIIRSAHHAAPPDTKLPAASPASVPLVPRALPASVARTVPEADAASAGT